MNVLQFKTLVNKTTRRNKGHHKNKMHNAVHSWDMF